MELIKCLVTNIDHQPQLALESVDVNQQNAEYICPGDMDDLQHCVLKLPQYTHFTSPIRRYIDIVVHRVLLSVIDVQHNNYVDREMYTREEIAEICKECNDSRVKVRQLKYESCCSRLRAILRERSVMIYAVVQKINESDILLLFPNLQPISIDRTVTFSSLKPSVLPERTVNDAVTLKWKQRIYDLRISAEMRSTTCEVVKLSPHQYQVQVKATDWKALFRAVTAEDKEAINEAISALVKDNRTENSVEKLTSEGQIVQSGKHFCEYLATFSRASIVKIQLAAKESYCVRPHIQLFHLTPSLCVCVEHNTSAVESFSEPATKNASVAKYNDIGHYQKLWRPVLEVEAAYSAVSNGNSIIMHHVDIHWKRQKSTITGTFKISTDFCRERNIIFPVDEEPAVHHADVKGYVCVRYSGSLKPVSKKALCDDTFQGVLEVDKSFTWVGHCVVTHVVTSLDNTYYVIHLLLKQNTCTLPKERKYATIEWIPKLVPDR